MDYQTVNKSARAFLKSIGVVNPLRATYNAERTWKDGFISYIIMPLNLREPVNAAKVAHGIAENLGKKPAKPPPVTGQASGDVVIYRWTSPTTGNIIAVTDKCNGAGVVMITLFDPHYRAPKTGEIDEDAVHNAGKIGYR